MSRCFSTVPWSPVGLLKSKDRRKLSQRTVLERRDDESQYSSVYAASQLPKLRTTLPVNSKDSEIRVKSNSNTGCDWLEAEIDHDSRLKAT